MTEQKILITDELLKLIVSRRKGLNIKAYDMSDDIKGSKFWLPNIENRKIKFITEEDLSAICKYLDIDIQKQLSSTYLRHDSRESFVPMADVSNWLTVGPVSAVYRETSLSSMENEFSELVNSIKEALTDIFNSADEHQKRTLLTALCEFNNTLDLTSDAAVLLLGIPISVVSYLPEKTQNSHYQTLHDTFLKYEELATNNSVLIQHSKEINEIRKSNLRFMCNVFLNVIADLHRIYRTEKNIEISDISHLISSIDDIYSQLSFLTENNEKSPSKESIISLRDLILNCYSLLNIAMGKYKMSLGISKQTVHNASLPLRNLLLTDFYNNKEKEPSGND